jgi:Secretion system C-terminal sorting domain/Domain of unknown function DUF11
MKSFFAFFSGVLLTSQLSAQAVLPNNCLAGFQMARGTQFPASCNDKSWSTHSPASLQLLGKHISDGFTWHDLPASAGGSFIDLYGHNGTTVKPTGAIFRNCTGNWTYFKINGVTRNPRRHTSKPYMNAYARIQHYGNEANPDSVRVEFTEGVDSQPYMSFLKKTTCDNCIAVDRTPPTIHGPTQTVLFPLTAPTKVSSASIFAQANVKVTDSCPIDDITTYPYERLSTAGETVNYTTIAYDKAGNRATFTFKVLFTKALADTCLPRFSMNATHSTVCNAAGTPIAYVIPTFQMLGKRIADGFAWMRPFPPGGGTRETFYARNGATTPPAGIVFNNCLGNWTYFKIIGFTQTARGVPKASEVTTVYARVRYFGNEQNPDSLRVEFVGGLFEPYYTSFRKEITCDKCLATDHTPPVIKNCPASTQVLSYALTSNSLSSSAIVQAAKLQVSDNCGLPTDITFPYFKLDAQVGQTIDYKTLAFDQAGNVATCNFKVQYVQATPDMDLGGYATPDTYTKNSTVVYSVFVGNQTLNTMKNVRVSIPYPANTTSGGVPIPSAGTWHATCANGQKCYEWVIPEILGRATVNIQIPVYIANLTTPVKITAQILESTPADGNSLNNQTTITVQPSTVVPVVPQFVENQSIPMVVKGLSPNPTDGALQVLLTSTVAQSVDFDIYNTYGQRVHSAVQSVLVGENQLFFDLTKLPTGTYFIQARDQAVHTEKHTFVKY